MVRSDTHGTGTVPGTYRGGRAGEHYQTTEWRHRHERTNARSDATPPKSLPSLLSISGREGLLFKDMSRHGSVAPAAPRRAHLSPDRVTPGGAPPGRDSGVVESRVRNTIVDTTRPPWCEATPKVVDAGQTLPIRFAAHEPLAALQPLPCRRTCNVSGHVSRARATVQRRGKVSEHCCAHAGPRDRVCAGEVCAMAR